MKTLSERLDTMPKTYYVSLLLSKNYESLEQSDSFKKMFDDCNGILGIDQVTESVSFDDKSDRLVKTLNFYTNRIPEWKSFCKKNKIRMEIDN